MDYVWVDKKESHDTGAAPTLFVLVVLVVVLVVLVLVVMVVVVVLLVALLRARTTLRLFKFKG